MGNQKLIPKAKGWLTHPRKAMVQYHTPPTQTKQPLLSLTKLHFSLTLHHKIATFLTFLILSLPLCPLTGTLQDLHPPPYSFSSVSDILSFFFFLLFIWWGFRIFSFIVLNLDNQGLFLMALTVLEFDMGFYTPVYNSVVVGSFCFNPFGSNLFLFDDFYTL